LKCLLLSTVAAAAAAFALTVAGPGAARAAASPPDAMFVHGYNLCKVTTLTALNKTTGKKFTKATNYKSFCIWSSGDGNYALQVDVHPLGYTEYGAYPIGKRPSGDVNSMISVPGASKAILVTHSHALTGRYARDVLGVYPQGVVSVSLIYATPLPTSTAVAVTRLVTHT